MDLRHETIVRSNFCRTWFSPEAPKAASPRERAAPRKFACLRCERSECCQSLEPGENDFAASVAQPGFLSWEP